MSPAKPRIVYDIDGTLFCLPDGQPGTGSRADIARQVPIHANVARALQYRAEGFELHFVTGRTLAVHDLTRDQLEVHFGDIDGRLHMQEAWTGYGAMVDFKHQCIADLQAVLVVGDTSFDEQAAAVAGVAFRHAHTEVMA